MIACAVILASSSGVRCEGFARDYLFIDGAWRVHVLASLTNPDMLGRPPKLPL
jgi:[ribosomal protein S5]-alanine N-acetyltransferase